MRTSFGKRSVRLDENHCGRRPILREEGTFMSSANTAVPSLLTTTLPDPVPASEYDACPVTELFRRLGDKWTLLVLVLLGERAHRFNELHRRIDGISQRMLTRTLRTLEDDGLVQRTVFPTVPPSVEYSLSGRGRSLLPALAHVATWVVENRTDTPAGW
jgi:DNA-binding HxlR family transcriptional regulator